MSTVRMSADLQYKIANNARDTYNVANPEREIPSDVGNKIYDKYLKEKFETIQMFLLSEENISVLDKKCTKIKPISKLRLKLKYCHTQEQVDHNGVAEMVEVNDNFNFDLSLTNREITALLSTDPANDYHDHVAVQLQIDITGYDNDSVPSKDFIDLSCPLFSELISIRQHNDKVYNGGRDYKQKVQETIASFTTLNQALKAWPALKDFVPQDKIDKVYEKVERKAKQQQQREAIEVQEQELNSVILTASLLGD